jgi:ParB family chromosome partitioning protein
VQSKVVAGVLSAGHARALLGAADETTMRMLAERTIREGLSVRGLEELVSGIKVKPKKAKITAGGRTEMLSEIADRLSDRYDTRVKIQLGRKKGQLIFEFANLADLKRVVEELER